jgi:hypothetical protein
VTASKTPEDTCEDMATAPTDDVNNDREEDFSFSSSAEKKPQTGRELYRALVENGFIGGWKDRTDIGDSVKYARLLRRRATERLRGQ